MAPKFKVTKDQVIAVAVKITRETGIDRVTARELGAKLGVSSRRQVKEESRKEYQRSR